MRKRFLNSIIWIVAISILNTSISIPDISSDDFGNTPMEAFSNWNEFESIYEWVAEAALDIKNAVPELQDGQGDEHVILKKHTPDFVPIRFEKEHIIHTISYRHTVKQPDRGSYKPLAGYITLFSPPPDMVA